MKGCPSCGRKLKDGTDVCPSCGHEFMDEGQEKESLKPIAAGVMMFVSSAFGIIMGALILSGFWDLPTMIETAQNTTSQDMQIAAGLFKRILQVCAIIFIVFGSIQVVGGVFSLKRRKWWIAILGAILGIFLVGVLFISSILSFIAMILLFMSKDEFV